MVNQKKLNLILYLLLSVISIVTTLLLLIPYTRDLLINILFTIVGLVYLIFYLFKGVIKEKKTPIIIINVVEIVLVSVLLFSVFIPYNIYKTDIKQIIGMLLWLRGTSSILSKYFSHSTNNYQILTTALDIVLITSGAILLTSTVKFRTDFLSYVLSIIMICSLVYGIVMIIKSTKQQKNL